MASLLIWVVVGVAVAGLILCILGFRGRRVGDHPVCRRCGFDLSGLPVADAGAPTPCPECGADLTIGKAIRNGIRRRRPGVVFIGSVLILSSTAGLAAQLAFAASPAVINPYKPISLLVWELERGVWSSEADLATEFERRRTKGTLSASDESLVIDAALLVQGDLSRTWPTNLGDFVETSSNISASQRALFKEQMVVWDAEVRPVVRKAGPIPVLFTISEIRSGMSAHGSRMLIVRDLLVDRTPSPGCAGRVATVDDEGVYALPGVYFNAYNGKTTEQLVEIYPLVPGGVDPGPIRLTFRLAQHEPTAWHAARARGTTPPLNWGPVRELDLLLSDDDQTVEIREGDDGTVKFGQLSQQVSSGPVLSILSITIARSPEGVSLAHSAWVRYPDGGESLLGYVTTGRGGSRYPAMQTVTNAVASHGPTTFRIGPTRGAGYGLHDVPLFPVGTHLILRPDPEFAEHLIDPVVLTTGELDAGEFTTHP